MRGNGQDTAAPIGGNPLGELFQVRAADVLDFWMEGPRVVKTVLLSHEQFEGHRYEWVWMFLDDGSLVEASPDGYFRYREHHLLRQGTALYEELVAQDGALVRYEERVRLGTADERPVEFNLNDRTYRMTSTGTVIAQRLGDEPELLTWKSFSADQRQNVYFGLADVTDEAQVGVGLWTAHVCVSLGRALEQADLTAIYRK